jgi:HlyD family secretion protein
VLVPVCIGLMLALALWAAMTRRGSKTGLPSSNPFSTATASRRDFVRTLRLHGIVEAVQAYTVTVPRLAGPTQTGPGSGALVITKLVRSGVMVKRGDLLVEFDRQTQIKNALDRKAEYSDFEEQIKKKRADQAAARAHDETELKQAENAVETARLEMLKNEVISKINAEKNQLNLEEAIARGKQLQETFDLKRVAAEAELRVLEIQRDRARDAMLYAQSNAEKMSVRAPQDGLAVLSTIWNNSRDQMAEVLEGEEVHPGSPILQVVDPSGMRIRARINQADLSYLRAGQAARIFLDAYPGIAFPGRLDQVAPVGTTSNFSDKVHTFISVFSIQGSDAKLIPDLSAAVEVELEHLTKVLVLPRDSVRSENDQFYVNVRNGFGFEKRLVRIGARSDYEVVVESGLEAGTIVLRHNAS